MFSCFQIELLLSKIDDVKLIRKIFLQLILTSRSFENIEKITFDVRHRRDGRPKTNCKTNFFVAKINRSKPKQRIEKKAAKSQEKKWGWRRKSWEEEKKKNRNNFPNNTNSSLWLRVLFFRFARHKTITSSCRFFFLSSLFAFIFVFSSLFHSVLAYIFWLFCLFFVFCIFRSLVSAAIRIPSDLTSVRVDFSIKFFTQLNIDIIIIQLKQKFFEEQKGAICIVSNSFRLNKSKKLTVDSHRRKKYFWPK